MRRDFTWSERKAEANVRKHGISFDEAATAFDDPLFVVFSDPDHSIEENRLILMGESIDGRLLVISYTQHAEAVRLISARRATPRERNAYEEDI